MPESVPSERPPLLAENRDARAIAAPVTPRCPAPYEPVATLPAWRAVLCGIAHAYPRPQQPLEEARAQEEGARRGARRGDVRSAADSRNGGTRRRSHQDHASDTRRGTLAVRPLQAPVPPVLHAPRRLEPLLLVQLQRACGRVLERVVPLRQQ